MAFIEQSNQIPLAKSIGLDEVETEDDISFGQKLGAAFRVENTIGSAMVKDGQLPDSYMSDPSFNPLSYLSDDEKQDERFVMNAAMADNTDEIEGLRRQQIKEQGDKGKLSGVDGFVAGLTMGVLDPINLIPVGGTAYKTYRGGASILKAGVITAGVSAASATATEAGLHYSQATRTYSESAINVAGATLLGGVLGASPSAVRQMLSNSGHDPDRALADIEATFSPEQVLAEGGNPAFTDKSIGAAQVMNDAKVRGKVAKAVTKFVGFDPLSRSITSDLKETRVAAVRLAENPVAMDRSVGASVESKVKIHDGKMYQGIDAHAKIYRQYKEGGGVLAKRDFNEAVGKAVRNGSDDIHVQSAADSWNKFVYEPLKQDAINVKLLADDVEVTTAKNYLNRLWNKEKLNANLKTFNDITSEWLILRNPKITLDEAKDLANEIAGRIMSTPDGRLPYEYKIGENAAKGSGKSSGVVGQFKARSFDIDDSLVEEFLENDIELLASRYVRNVAPDIELMREFGDVNMTKEIKDIETEYNFKIENAENAKQAKKLGKQKDRDIESIAAMRDRIRGTYSVPDGNNPWVRAGRVMRDLNYMRLLGGVVAASVPDVARLVMAEGLTNTFRHGLAPLAKNLSTFKVSAAEAKTYGIGIDALMGGRAEIIADTTDFAQGGTAFERGVRSAATKFSTLNGMNHWTSGIKQLHAVVAQTVMTKDLLAGKYDARLGQLGIDEANSKNIAAQLRSHARKIDGVWIANTKDWSNPNLADMWRTALRKESDRVIVVPGQEKPLFMSSELGKTIFQFKTFMFSATQRVLISSIQNQDKHSLQGILGLVSIGAMSYAFKQWDADREISTDPKILIMEGIDRSGVLGSLMEMNNTIEKVSANNIGMRPLFGIDAPASRYASRNFTSSLVGPSFGLIQDFSKVAGAATGQYDWAESDTRALRRLLPAQNLSFFRQGLDKIENEVNKSIGVK